MWEPLRDVAVARIKRANVDGSLWETQSLPYVLFCWVRWTDEASVRAAVASHVQSDAALLAFIGKFISNGHSHTLGDKVARKRTVLDRKGLGSLLDLDVALAQLRPLTEGDDETAAIARGVVELLEKKPEFPWDQ